MINDAYKELEETIDKTILCWLNMQTSSVKNRALRFGSLVKIARVDNDKIHIDDLKTLKILAHAADQDGMIHREEFTADYDKYFFVYNGVEVFALDRKVEG